MHSPMRAEGGILPRLTSSLTMPWPLLMRSMASPCVMFFVLMPLISMARFCLEAEHLLVRLSDSVPTRADSTVA